MTKHKKDTRQWLIESAEFVADVRLPADLKESVQLERGKYDTLIVRNIPVTILNRKNLNGRIYSTRVLQEAIKNARHALETRQLLSAGNEHPEGSFVPPTDASHVLIDAYIKRNIEIEVEGEKGRWDVLFEDWLVLNTQNGKNLRALFEGECSIGTSIRGLGDMNGDQVINYQLVGTDCVGNPSSSTYTRMPVSESVTLEYADSKKLNENFIVSSSSTDVVRDYEQTALMNQKLDHIEYGTVTKTSTKLDSEIDPKTGAETTMVTFETETEDEVSTLDQALYMARMAILNKDFHIDSVTIENVDETTKESTTAALGAGVQYLANKELKEEITEDEIRAALRAGKTVCRNGNLGYRVFEDTNGKLRIRASTGQVVPLAPAFCDMSEIQILDDEPAESVIVESSMALARSRDGKYTLSWQKGDFYTIDDSTQEIYKGYSLSKALKDFKKLTNNDFIALINGLEKDLEVQAESLTEAKVNEEDPNAGRQYVLRIKNIDSEMQEEKENEFVAMKGNAICFTKDPQKALHFTQGMEESGIVHYSNIEKLLGNMGYGNHNIEKWYKKDQSVSLEEAEDLKEYFPVIPAVLSGLSVAARFALKKILPQIIKQTPKLMLAKATADGITDITKSTADAVSTSTKVISNGELLKNNTKGFIEGLADAIAYVSSKVGVGLEKAGKIVYEVFKANPVLALSTVTLATIVPLAVKFAKQNNVDGEKEFAGISEGLMGGALGAGAGAAVGSILGGPLGAISAAASGYTLGDNIADDLTTEAVGDTKYTAKIKTVNEDGSVENNEIPVSAVETDSIINEVLNHWKQKSNQGRKRCNIMLLDNTTKKTYKFDPNKEELVPLQKEMTEEIEQNQNALSIDIGGNSPVEKEFDSVAQASVVKAGLERGLLDGGIMLDEDVKMPMSEFLKHCKACGGNWTGMLLSGIKEINPEYFDKIPEDQDIDLAQALKMVDEAGVDVSKYYNEPVKEASDEDKTDDPMTKAIDKLKPGTVCKLGETIYVGFDSKEDVIRFFGEELAEEGEISELTQKDIDMLKQKASEEQDTLEEVLYTYEPEASDQLEIKPKVAK